MSDPINNPWKNAAQAPSGPARGSKNITPSDTEDLPIVTRGLRVGTAGVVYVQPLEGEVTFYVCPAGDQLPVQVTRVLATGTTAGNIVAWW